MINVKLYNAWTKTIRDRLKELGNRVKVLVEGGTDKVDIDIRKEVKEMGRMDMDTFLEKAGLTVSLVERFGKHNFNLTRTILDCL